MHRLPIEVRGQLSEHDHLDAFRIVQRRLGTRWHTPALCLGVPALIVALSVLAGSSLTHALVQNLFWIIFGLLLLLSLPLAAKQAARSILKGNPAATHPQLYRFTETGFEERECPVEVSIAWSNILEAVETERILLLFTGRTMGYIVSRSALAAAGRLEDVRALLREQLGERARLSPS